MIEWAQAIGKRNSVYTHMMRKRWQQKMVVFQCLREHLGKKQAARERQLHIIDHFGSREPWVLQLFSKVFLIMNHLAALNQH